MNCARWVPARRRLPTASAALAALFFVSAICAVSSCSGSDGSQGPAGPPGSGATNTVLHQGDDLPGVNLTITGVSGGTATGGRFRVGDRPAVTFTLTKDDASSWDLAEFSFARTLVSGPTFNYQRVIAEKSDVGSAAVLNTDGSYTYTFADPIPATYLAPLNDTASFGAADGELQGEALLDGTYTVGLYVAWSYTVDGEAKRAAGNATFDFVLGNSGVVDTREVVKQDNCNRCHADLQAHGGLRHNVTLCLLCHTAGAEDRNTPSVAGGTPGVSIDFKVMVHKLHTGEHLPSVLGVGTNPDGSRTYAATPTPYEMIGFGDSLIDFSHIAFPAWPNGQVPLPRDQGYTALSAPNKATEDVIREGPANCAVCHGDPDGTGPLTAPTQGLQHRTQPTRAACGSCHDDIAWGLPYTANGQTMPEQANNSNCVLCHEATGNPLAVADAHLHPLNDPTFDGGVVTRITNVTEAGANNGDGRLQPGEKIQISFAIEDDSGAPLVPSTVANLTAIVSGPTSNYNVVLNYVIPVAALSGAQPYTVNLPAPVFLERVGVSTGALESFTTARAPHWNVSGAATSVLVRTATAGGSSTLASAASAPQNYVDVASAAGFARDDYIVLDDGTGAEEYLRIQTVDGTRLWFGQTGSTGYPFGVTRSHAAGATVQEVTLTTKTVTTQYTLNATTGAITEVTEFGAGNVVLCSYSVDFVLPTTYPLAINDTPTIGEDSGKWTGKPLVDGTYSVGIWTSRTLTLSLYGETNSYRSASDTALADFLVGASTTLEPYALISSGQNCYSCHQDLAFHGFGRRGFEACVLCHGTSGIEDRPQYVAPNAPATPGNSAGFRTLLHKIHMGEELANASTYEFVGFGSGSYPNNFGVSGFGEIVFPTLPGGARNCTICHGATNVAWHAPAPRNHPTDQGAPVKRWAAVCGACHDSDDAQAHISVQTTAAGAESCGVCHGESGEWSAERVHKAY